MKMLKKLRRLRMQSGRRLYQIKINHVDSADYGVPQRRKRVYVIGVKNPSSLKLPVRKLPVMKPTHRSQVPLATFLLPGLPSTPSSALSSTALENMKWARERIATDGLRVDKA